MATSAQSVANVHPEPSSDGGTGAPLPWDNEAQLHALFDTLPAVVIIVDRDGIYRFLGGKEHLAAGHTTQKIGQSVFTEHQDRPDILADIRLALAGETIQSMRTARERIWETQYAPLRDDAGAILGVIYVALDITARALIETALQASESRLRAQYQAFPLPTYTWQHRDGEFLFVDHNSAADTFAAGAIAAERGQSVSAIYREFPAIHECLRRSFVERTTLRQEVRFQDRDLIVTFVYVAPDLVVMHSEDITERRRTDTLLANQAIILNMIAQDAPLAETLTQLASSVEAISDGARVSILLAKPDNATLECIAAPSLPESYVQATRQIPVGEGIGSCGTAAFRRTPVVVGDIADHPFWRDYRDLALGSGLRACWSIPILTRTGDPDDPADHLLGTFAVYSTVPRQPTATDWQVLERSVGLAATAIERARAAEALRQNANIFNDIFDAAAEGLLIHANGRVLAANRTYAAMVGYAAEEIVGSDGFRFLTPETQEESKRRSRLGDEQPYEAIIVRNDGTTLPVDLAGKAITYQGQAARLVTVRDISARKAAEEALRTSEASLAAAQELAHLGSWEEDLRTGRIVWSDEAFRIFGHEPQSFEPTVERILAAIHPNDRLAFLNSRHAPAAFDTPREFHYRIARPNGETRAVFQHSVVVADELGQPLKRRGVILDVTERRALEERLAHQATHDALTGLPNRTLFLDRLGHTLSRTRRGGAPCAVFFLDLDNFKVVNDSLGHEAGDRLLITLGKRLRSLLRDADTLARLGGDEFAILLDAVANASEAAEIARRLAEAIEVPVPLNGQTFRVTASIGIVISTAEYVRPDDLLRDADIAMYRAKGEGKASYALFDPAMQAQIISRLAIEHDLRGALERNELQLHYQPLINLTTGRVAEVEALLRWQHPVRGAVPADVFIPIAEESGMIATLGRWVLREACRQARAWVDQNSPLTVSINLSAREFQQSDLAEVVAAALDEFALPPSLLRLEITERLAMRDATATRASLTALRALGIHLAIDDFGTGYSSLAYLRRFPVDALKIDRSFIAGLGTNNEDGAIVEAITSLGLTLGLGVIAEGTETAAQVAHLRAIGCTLAQGYFFARPMDATALSAHLVTHALPTLPGAVSLQKPTTGEFRERRAARSRISLLPTSMR